MSKKLQLIVVNSVDGGECDWTVYYGEPLTNAEARKIMLGVVRDSYGTDDDDKFNLGDVYVNEITVDGYKIIMEKTED